MAGRTGVNGTAQPTVRKGDLAKQKKTGGHVMTVTEVSKDQKAVIASYSTPDGQRHDEQWRTADLKRVVI